MFHNFFIDSMTHPAYTGIMTYDIQRINNLPDSKRRKTYPFDDLNIGDAWFVPASDVAAFPNIRNAACQYGLRYGKQLKTSILADGRLCVLYVGNRQGFPIVGTIARAGKDELAPPVSKVYPPAFASAEAFRTHLSHFAPEQRDYVPKEFAEIHSHIIAEVAKLADETGKRYYTLPQNDGRLIYGLLPSVESKPIFFTDESTAEPAVANAE